MRDQAPHARANCGGEVARALDAKPRVGHERRFISRRAGSARQVGELMNDCIRRRRRDGPGKRCGIEHIDHHRLGAERTKRRLVRRLAGGADNGMPTDYEQRYQGAAD